MLSVIAIALASVLVVTTVSQHALASAYSGQTDGSTRIAALLGPLDGPSFVDEEEAVEAENTIMAGHTGLHSCCNYKVSVKFGV